MPGMNIYTLLLFVALVLAYFSIRNYYKTNQLIIDGEITDATVIDFRESRDDDGTTYAPVFQYKDSKGKIIIYEYGIYSSPKAYAVNQIVKLVYDPLDMNKRKVISFWGLYRWSVILLMVASPLFVLAISYWWYLSR